MALARLEALVAEAVMETAEEMPATAAEAVAAVQIICVMPEAVGMAVHMVAVEEAAEAIYTLM